MDVNNRNSIMGFIELTYDVKFKGDNVNKDFSNVSEFLLSDKHDSMGYDMINSLFISIFSRKDDIILVEMTPSMQEIHKDENLQSININSDAPIVGWDHVELEKEFKEEMPNLSKLDNGTKLRILFRNLRQCSLETNPEERKLEIEGKIIALIRKIFCSCNYGLEVDLMMPIVSSTFPRRTESMQDSLEKAKKIGNNTFLISGAAHLWNWPLEVEKDQDRKFKEIHCVWLDKFHQFLKSRNVVVLTPKASVTEPIDKEYSDLFTGYYNRAYAGSELQRIDELGRLVRTAARVRLQDSDELESDSECERSINKVPKATSEELDSDEESEEVNSAELELEEIYSEETGTAGPRLI